MKVVATICAMLGVSLIVGLPLWGVAFDLTGPQTLFVLLLAFLCLGMRLGLLRFILFAAPGSIAIMIGLGLARLGGYPMLGTACAVGGSVLLVGSLMLATLHSAIHRNTDFPECLLRRYLAEIALARNVGRSKRVPPR